MNMKKAYQFYVKNEKYIKFIHLLRLVPNHIRFGLDLNKL